MTSIKTAAIATALCLAAPVTCFAASAAPATVPFNEALTFAVNDTTSSGSPPYYFDNQFRSAPATLVTSSYSFADATGSSSAFASADLATGQLKTRAASSASIGSSFPPSIQSNAIFGDGFTTTTTGGSPFVWTSATTAQFSIALSGTISSLANGSPAPLSTTSGNLFLDIQILKKGAVTPAVKLVGDPNAIANYFYTFGGSTGTIYYTDQNGNSTAVPLTQAFAGLPASFSQAITPGGDFDFTLLLGESGQPPAGDSFDIDLSHTLTLNYITPAGTHATDATGTFNNITTAALPVPEPTSITLLAAGLLGLAVSRRRI